MLSVVRAVEAGATTMKGVIDATGLSRLKIERALTALEKQKLLVRDGQGFRATGLPRAARPARQCGSCNACCDILEVAGVDKPVNQLCKHWQAGTGCTIYDRRPQMCRSFVCAWLQGHLDDDWFPAKSGIVVHFSQDAVNVTVDDDCPDRWREEPYFSKLAEWSLNGVRRIGNRGYATLVVSGTERFLLLGRTLFRIRRCSAPRSFRSPPTPSDSGGRRRPSICSGCMSASPRSTGSGRNSAPAPFPRTRTTIRIRPIGPHFYGCRITPELRRGQRGLIRAVALDAPRRG